MKSVESQIDESTDSHIRYNDTAWRGLSDFTGSPQLRKGVEAPFQSGSAKRRRGKIKENSEVKSQRKQSDENTDSYNGLRELAE